MTPFATRLQALVRADAAAPAVTDRTGTLSRADLDRRSNQWARALLLRGVDEGDIVSICLPSDARFLVAAWAVWKVGATPQPLSARLVPNELREILALTRPALVLGTPPTDVSADTWDLTGADDLSDAPLPPRTAPCWKAPTSGGSTGRPKVILSTSPADAEPLEQLGGAPAAACGRRPADAGSAAPQRAVPVGLAGPAAWRARRADGALRPRAGARPDRAAPGRLGLRRPDHHEQDCQAPAPGDGGGGPVQRAHPVPHGRPLRGVAEALVDRPARRRRGLGALRRHGGPGHHRHRRPGVAGAARLGRPSAGRRDRDPGRSRRPRPGAARSGRSTCGPARGSRPTATSAARQPPSTAGSRSATSGTSTRTATCTSATGPPTWSWSAA